MCVRKCKGTKRLKRASSFVELAFLLFSIETGVRCYD
nr:MAG TPA: hypothetical protein [Caudoviricetes sp.]